MENRMIMDMEMNIKTNMIMTMIMEILGTMIFEFMDIPYHQIIYSTGNIIYAYYQ